MQARLAQDRVSLYAEPDLRSKVLAALSAPAEIEIGASIQNAGLNWIEVRTPAGLGYIKADSALVPCAASRGSREEVTAPSQTGTSTRPVSFPKVLSTCLSVVMFAALGMWISADAFRKPVGFATLPNGMGFAQMGPDPVWMIVFACLGGILGWVLDALGQRRFRR